MEARERWLQARAIFEDALDLEPQKRSSFIERASDGDEELRREVVSLLEALEKDGDFMETPVTCLTGISPEAWMSDSAVGKRFGNYRAIATLAQGGMSTVYLGERADREYVQRVCIKLIRPGFESEIIVRRFVSERQILARLEHPNIARLLDGGRTEEGLPYFVMEYVDGVRLDEYCDSQGLDVPERLKLFCKICEAVHFAHQNLVIHRDIKPGNILVDAAGEPKLLDFGIAKLLAPDAPGLPPESTLTLLRAMTPQYASPEQVRGGVISTASDVYSLGVLLYELLAGHRPYQASGLTPETVRAVCEEDPQKPSVAVGREGAVSLQGDATLTPRIIALGRGCTTGKLRRALAGDLDNIVLKAMRKEPERRYASAEQLAEDIRRHLQGLPVRAQEDTLQYRVAKFAGRNKAGLAAAGLVVLTLALGVAATAWQAAIAQRRFNEVRALARSNITELHDAIAPLPGSTAARKLLVSRALQYLDGLAKEAWDDASLQRELASAYQQVGDIQGNRYNANLGDTVGALQSYRRAVTIRERLAQDSNDSAIRLELAAGYERLGDVFGATGKTDLAEAYYRKALDIRKGARPGVGVEEGARAEFYRDLASGYYRLGDLLIGANPPSAAAVYREGLRAALVLSRPEIADAKTRRVVMIGHNKLGRALIENDATAALATYREALSMAKRLWAEKPGDRQARRDLMLAHLRVGDALGNPRILNQGNWTGALAHYRRSLDTALTAVVEDRTDSRALGDLGDIHERVGDVLIRLGDPIGALENYAAGLAGRQKLLAKAPTNAQARARVALSYEEIGDVHLATGQPLTALRHHQLALSAREALSLSDPSDTTARRNLADTHSDLGDVHNALAGRSTTWAERLTHWLEARSQYQQSLRLWRKIRDDGALTRSTEGEPSKVAARLARCQAALSNSPHRHRAPKILPPETP